VYDYESVPSKSWELGKFSTYHLAPSQYLIHWSSKEKLGPDGDVYTHQIRVVAGGHKQVYGVDYNEMFATAAKMPSVRVVLANGAQQDWEMHQVDVKSAYLNAPLEDDIYMIPPKGVLKPGQEGKVCKFLKRCMG